MASAQREARSLGHTQITDAHLLLGVLSADESVGATVLRKLGIDRPAVLAQLPAFVRSDADALRTIGVDLDEVRRRAESAFGPGALDRPRLSGWDGSAVA